MPLLQYALRSLVVSFVREEGIGDEYQLNYDGSFAQLILSDPHIFGDLWPSIYLPLIPLFSPPRIMRLPHAV